MAESRSNVIIAAFTEEEAERLTGVSQRQLRYWDRARFFAPSLAYEDRSKPLSRLYSFRDLVCLKVLNALRNEARISLPHLKETKEKLAHLGDDMWAKTTLYVLNKKVVFWNPETSQKEEAVSGQGVLQIPLQIISGDMEEAVQAMRRRESTAVGRIARKRGVVQNQPVIAGTRIPVSSIKAFAEAGYSVEAIRNQYPTLTAQDIKAAIAYKDVA